MLKNKKVIVSMSLLLMFIGGCNMNPYVQNINKVFEKARKTFGTDIKKSNLLDIFPDRIKNSNIFLEVNPPSCPPTGQCIAQFGDIFLAVTKSDYEKYLSRLFKKKIEYETDYSVDNIIINLNEFKRDIFPIEKCNKWHANKLPIPFFEMYDFGLGKNETKKIVNGKIYYNYTYKIPPDLRVYVVKAEAGNFWKEDCNEVRPKHLKEWKHGYSKGFAVSDKKNIIIFWAMVW